MEVESWNSDWGKLNESNMRKRLEEEGFSVITYSYSPGTYFSEHSHTIDKKDTVLSGKFKMTALGKEFILGPEGRPVRRALSTSLRRANERQPRHGVHEAHRYGMANRWSELPPSKIN